MLHHRRHPPTRNRESRQLRAVLRPSPLVDVPGFCHAPPGVAGPVRPRTGAGWRARSAGRRSTRCPGLSRVPRSTPSICARLRSAQARDLRPRSRRRAIALSGALLVHHRDGRSRCRPDGGQETGSRDRSREQGRASSGRRPPGRAGLRRAHECSRDGKAAAVVRSSTTAPSERLKVPILGLLQVSALLCRWRRSCEASMSRGSSAYSCPRKEPVVLLPAIPTSVPPSRRPLPRRPAGTAAAASQPGATGGRLA